MSEHIDRAAEVLREHTRVSIVRCHCGWSDLWRSHAEHVAQALDVAGLLVTPEHDAAVAAKAWDEGFKQGGPMHDENYDDPDAHTRNPYRIEHKGEAS